MIPTPPTIAKYLHGATTAIMQRGGYTGAANDNRELLWDFNHNGKRHVVEKYHPMVAHASAQIYKEDRVTDGLSDERIEQFTLICFYYDADGVAVDLETRNVWL